jgi:hypothetical protein
MRKRLQQFLSEWQKTLTEAGRLTRLRDHLHRASADVDREFEQDYLSNKVFRASGTQQIERARKELLQQTTRRRQTAAAVGLFRTENPMRGVRRELAAITSASRRPPSPLDAWAESAGKEADRTPDFEKLQIELADEIRQLRWNSETSTWPPSKWLAKYLEARDERLEPATSTRAASFIAYTEDRMGQGWSGSEVRGEAEENAAISLRRTIDEVQRSRVPSELGEVEESLREVERLCVRTRHGDGLLPINDAMEMDATGIYEQELQLAEHAAADRQPAA